MFVESISHSWRCRMMQVRHGTDGRVFGRRRRRHAGRTLADVPFGQVGLVRIRPQQVRRVAQTQVGVPLGQQARTGRWVGRRRRRRRARRRRIVVRIVVRIVRIVAGGSVRRRALAVHLHVLAQGGRVRVRLVASAHLAIVRLVRGVHVRMLLAIRTIGESPVASVEFAFERFLSCWMKEKNVPL